MPKNKPKNIAAAPEPPASPFCASFGATEGHAGSTRMFEQRVDTSRSGQRLDQFLAALLAEHGISRQHIKQLILEGRASIDGAICTLPRQTVLSGQLVHFAMPPGKDSPLEAQEGSLSIIYRDKNFLVLNKPPNLTVHPCPSCTDGTLVNILLHHFPELGESPGLRPGIVHRLDKDTSGLLVAALNEPTRLKLAEAFAGRLVSKQYLALACGSPHPPEGTINQPLARHPAQKTRMAVQAGGKEALSEYRTLYSYKPAPPQQASRRAKPEPLAEKSGFSLLAVKIHTGRTHQIRVHLSHLGHPIWGDKLYGGPEYLNDAGSGAALPRKIATRQMLHAWKLEFDHPYTGERLRFRAPLPQDFMEALGLLLEKPLQVVLTGLPGCGKSTLLGKLASLGLPVWSADEQVSHLYKAGNDGWLLMKGRFGGRFLDEQNELDKPALFAAMQDEPGLRREVEKLIHPLVRHSLYEFWQDASIGKDFTGSSPAVARIAEVPLFLETGWNPDEPPQSESQSPRWRKDWQRVLNEFQTAGVYTANTSTSPGETVLVYVDTPSAIRYARLAGRGVSPEQAAMLDSWQWPEDEKRKSCDLVVSNAGGLDELKGKAEILAKLLEGLALARNLARLDAVLALCSD